MKNVWAIYRRELSSYFTSWIAYVVLSLFLVIYGYFFYDYVYRFIDFGLRMAQMGGGGRTLNLNQDLNVTFGDGLGELVIEGRLVDTDGDPVRQPGAPQK